MLLAGGNAVDAALATAITLTVVEPISNGIGSDAFAIIWDGNKLHGLNASGRSPAAWTPDYFKGQKGVPVRGWNSVSVPGCVSACAGEIFRFPDQAKTLEKIAATKGEAFYRGEIAEKIAAHAIANGGAMTRADLAAHTNDWVGTISQDYRELTVHEIPPNGQGIVCLMALGILSNFDVADHPVDSADSAHLQIEAVKLAFADAYRFVGDPKAMQVTPKQLLDPDYLKSRAKLIDMKRAQDFGHGTPPKGGTVYLTAADASGMMVSMIQSNFMGFGSGVVVPG